MSSFSGDRLLPVGMMHPDLTNDIQIETFPISGNRWRNSDPADPKSGHSVVFAGCRFLTDGGVKILAIGHLDFFDGLSSYQYLLICENQTLTRQSVCDQVSPFTLFQSIVLANGGAKRINCDALLSA